MTYRFQVFGRVQGVYYRANVLKAAQLGKFKGYVKNLADGSVEAVAHIADDARLREFEALLKKGSPRSVVERIEKEQIETDVFDGFVIR